MSNLYMYENIKAKLTFENGMTYEVELNSRSNDRYVTYFNKRQTESINYNSLFGSITSNTISLSIFDSNNYLDINNANSPYFDYMRHGVKIELTIRNRDLGTYEPFGTFYVTKWSNSFYNGLQDVTPIQAEDEITYILNRDMPKLPAYSGVKASKLITDVLVACGIDKNRIRIDSSLDYDLPFGTTEDEKVGYFLNSICTALCAVMTINDDNDILIYSALNSYGKTWTMMNEIPIKFSGSNNDKSTYSRVKVTYDKAVGREVGTILDTMINIDGLITNIDGLTFSNKMLSVLEVTVEKDDISAEVLGFSAYQNGIDLQVKCVKDIEDMNLHIIGEKILTTKKYVTSDIAYSDRTKDRVVSLNMYNEYISTDEEAKVIANLMADYIANMDRQLSIETVYNPRIQTGDIIVFNNKLVKGQFKVISTNIIFNEVYTNVIGLMPLNKSVTWDDTKIWSDDIQWLDNNELSQV